ncbi:uncharacterized protein ARMOST_12913 [Armillaria ostoyae]|uniref:Uncharacterized protein n=1 Tax=Armillaria ostoyae TaxID=47428 RepID=A0A284RLA6_ARMOS|nr:uncharacterized protein ARMOST_12913 [Armillaria ostoyae]
MSARPGGATSNKTCIGADRYKQSDLKTYQKSGTSHGSFAVTKITSAESPTRRSLAMKVQKVQGISRELFEPTLVALCRDPRCNFKFISITIDCGPRLTCESRRRHTSESDECKHDSAQLK